MAAEEDADLIVIGVRHRTPVGQARSSAARPSRSCSTRPARPGRQGGPAGYLRGEEGGVERRVSPDLGLGLRCAPSPGRAPRPAPARCAARMPCARARRGRHRGPRPATAARPPATGAGAQVVDEQRGHEGVARRRLEDLDAEAVRAGVRRGERAVLDHRAGARGRGDVERHRDPVVPGHGGAPPLQPLGQRVVGSLLRHEAVVEAGVGAGRVVAPQQPPAAHRAQRRASQPHADSGGAVGAGGVLDRFARHGEDVRRRGEEGERRRRSGG